MLRHRKRRRQGRTWGCPRLGLPSWEGAAVLGLCPSDGLSPREAPLTAWSPHTTSVAAVLLQEKGLPVPRAQYREISANPPTACLCSREQGLPGAHQPLWPSGSEHHPRQRSMAQGGGVLPANHPSDHGSWRPQTTFVLVLNSFPAWTVPVPEDQGLQDGPAHPLLYRQEAGPA